MTEARALWFYIELILVPDISSLGLYHDDFVVSRSLQQPVTTTLAIAGLLALLLTTIYFRKKYPIAAFGILFFLLGHSLESSVISLELVHEHRNYLPMYGILLTISFYTLSTTSKYASLRVMRSIPLILILIFGSITTIRSSQWSNLFTLHFMEVTHHPNSLRANADIAHLYAFLPSLSSADAEEKFALGMRHYHKAYELSDRDSSGLLGLVGLSAQRNRPITQSWLKDLLYRLEHHPFSPSFANSLMSLEKCVTRGPCKSLSPANMDQLLQAALSNPSLYGKARSNILFSRSHLLLVGLDKREDAIEHALMAETLMPSNLEARISFLKVLINLNEKQKARAELEKLKRRDSAEAYSHELDELEALIETASAL